MALPSLRFSMFDSTFFLTFVTTFHRTDTNAWYLSTKLRGIESLTTESCPLHIIWNIP